MATQWPIFINNLSSKLASRDAKGPDDIGMFVANEYFNAIKTSQTPFGNIHQAGEKSILEEGFKKAFNMLYDSNTPMLNDKFGNSIYEDMFESFPNINLKTDPLCEMEKWILENKNTIDPFLFYQFFPSTCSNILDEVNIFGEIEVTQNNIDSKINDVDPTEVTMRVIGGDGVAPYEITYRLNNLEFKTITDSQGISIFEIPKQPGKYEYVFLSAIDSSGSIELKNVNQSASIEIKEGITPAEILIKQNSSRMIVPEMNESTRVDEVAKRILLQNDKSEYFKTWIEYIDINSTDVFLKKVKAKVLEWISSGKTFTNNLNDRVFQEEHIVYKNQIPEWLTSDFIIQYTYSPINNKYMDLETYKKSNQKNFNLNMYRLYLIGKDKESIIAKRNLYKGEKDRFDDLKRRWVDETAKSNKSLELDLIENDAYDVMANCIIKYWMSTATQPFKNSPAILPCNIPSPGIFTPISYGSKLKLSNDLRKAWNTGKQFKISKSLPVATRAVSTAVAVSCAKHLKNLKFIYVGKLSAGPLTIPMVSISPFTF